MIERIILQDNLWFTSTGGNYELNGQPPRIGNYRAEHLKALKVLWR